MLPSEDKLTHIPAVIQGDLLFPPPPPPIQLNGCTSKQTPGTILFKKGRILDTKHTLLVSYFSLHISNYITALKLFPVVCCYIFTVAMVY